MLAIKDKGILLNIEGHCERVLSKIDGLTKESFLENDDAIEIVCFNILQIGELVAHLDSDFTFQFNEQPWGQMTGMRNKIVHGYGSIDNETVWNTATLNIRPLLNYCKEILRNNIKKEA